MGTLAILPLEALLWTTQVKPVSYIFLPKMKPVSLLQSCAQPTLHTAFASFKPAYLEALLLAAPWYR